MGAARPGLERPDGGAPCCSDSRCRYRLCRVEARELRDALYLGGNADLYVLVDPCRDDEIEMVSVGAHRLEVIDEVSCPPGADAAGTAG